MLLCVYTGCSIQQFSWKGGNAGVSLVCSDSRAAAKPGGDRLTQMCVSAELCSQNGTALWEMSQEFWISAP